MAKLIKAISTPGHTHGCMSYHAGNMVFTGDTLLIRGCGRTDFQQGSTEALYHSVTEKLFNLSGKTRVYPGHDYNGNTCSSIDEERRWNPRIGWQKSLYEFIDIMENLNLVLPKKLMKLSLLMKLVVLILMLMPTFMMTFLLVSYMRYGS